MLAVLAATAFVVAMLVGILSLAYGIASTLELLDDEWYAIKNRRQFWVLMAQAAYNFFGLFLFGWYLAARHCVRWYRKLDK